MLDIEQIQSFYPGPVRVFKKNILREYLQYKILDIIYDSKYFEKLNFMGGTAIRIMHGNTRFSEDLDFDNLKLEQTEFEELSAFIQKRLVLEGYTIEIRNVFKNAYYCYLSIPNILYENKISGHLEEKLVIRLDTEPQGFDYTSKKVLINKFDVFTRINVVPSDILLAQKILAILYRKRTMGRDLVDTIFMLAKTKPNFDYLKQKAEIDNINELKTRLLSKCESLDLKLLIQDVEPFLINSSDSKKILLFGEYVKNLSF